MQDVPQDLLEKMINCRFERLVVINYHGRNQHGHIVWECKCDCGESTFSTTSLLTSSSKKSCGCLRREVSRDIRIKHGLTDHRLYGIWVGIKTRCSNPNDKIFEYYGGRGIRVCPEWENDFQCFYNWAMENGYRDDLSIDRYPNNDGNYEPSNCRWADSHSQAQNSRLAKLNEAQVIKIRSDSRSASEIAKSYDISKTTVNNIKNRKTWSNIP